MFKLLSTAIQFNDGDFDESVPVQDIKVAGITSTRRHGDDCFSSATQEVVRSQTLTAKRMEGEADQPTRKK